MGRLSYDIILLGVCTGWAESRIIWCIVLSDWGYSVAGSVVAPWLLSPFVCRTVGCFRLELGAFPELEEAELYFASG